MLLLRDNSKYLMIQVRAEGIGQSEETSAGPLPGLVLQADGSWGPEDSKENVGSGRGATREVGQPPPSQ